MEIEVIEGMKSWRQSHPKATLREMEAELNQRLAQMRARLLEEIAASSKAVEWEKGARPKCPTCGKEMHKRGKAKRRLKTGG
jgi:hypothetical protein